MFAALPLSLEGWLFLFGAAVLAMVVLTQIRDPLANLFAMIPVIGSQAKQAQLDAFNALIGHLEDFIRASEGVWAHYIRLPIERIVATLGEIPHTLAVMKAIELQHYNELRGRATGDENAINSYVWALQGADVRESAARYSADASIGLRQTGDENATNFYVHTIEAAAAAETATRVQADQATAARQTGDENAINFYVHTIEAAAAAETAARVQADQAIAARQTGDENAINTYVTQLRGEISTLNQAVSVRFGRDEAQEVADARNALAAAAAARQAAEQYTHEAVAAAETQAQADTARAEVRAQTALVAAQAQAASDLQRAQAVTAQEIATAEARAASDVLGARQYAATIAAQAASAAQTGAIAQSVPLVQALAGTLTHYLDTCGDPLCSGLLDTAHVLSGLQALAGSGLLLALVAGLIHDPERSGQAVNGALSGMISTVEQQVRRL